MPKRENVRFYVSAAAAADAGFRPCLRCRPESSPLACAWRGTATTVARALRLIEDGALDSGGVETLAERLGVGSRHLLRLFAKHVGATPVQVAQTRRLHLAKQLLDESKLPMTAIAYAAGYGSVRRFNEAIRSTYRRPASALRRSKHIPRTESELRLRLAYRPPLDWPAMLRFFELRMLPGVEQVVDGAYLRTIALSGAHGRIAIRPAAQPNQLELTVSFPDVSMLPRIVTRVRRMFDLDADPLLIERDLTRDRALAPHVKASPGLRVPGAWDGFELAVRAIVGQAVTVRGGRTLATRIAACFGDTLPGASPEACSIVFPTAAVLANADLSGLGLASTRAAAICNLAHCVDSGAIDFTTPQALDAFAAQLQAQPGIGPWTAQYLALRAFGQPDAFPAGDLGLLRGAERCLGLRARELTPAALARRADPWRPWRAYAAMRLWSAYTAS
jgi:AraC family transcriptional regulator of adaptative response / DNA-3-methyladenine glycosylase II